MTSVGTPIFVAPEVMKGERYGATADSYSFGICLVAMIRADKDVMEFYFQALRKKMKRKSLKGVGITILNTRMYTQGWRPLLPVTFIRAYGKLSELIYRCWSQVPEERPSFDEIVLLLQGEIGEEVKKKAEPEIVFLSQIPDEDYQKQAAGEAVMGGDEDEDEDADMDTARFVSRRMHEDVMKEMISRKEYEVLAAKDRELEEVLAAKDRELDELRRGS